ncbi:hypothetical protein [Methylovulum psychrotolerans]|uniref:Uncharacterized protein n=1 Tax=Methylovulum psychrotolerans TaxID=1704499 RepID=A0A1Z4BZQ6_9GAMM|nr:hypothetical protein [Methylovulum psychrotolerans]ASF46741.1 hypothetical protein CEK71_12015 [Methylovulum psychrotolerans]
MTENEIYQIQILAHLLPDDDPEFWSTLTDFMLHQVEAELDGVAQVFEVYAQIGACSHWLRPHQTRWTAAGGFAYPSGYGGSGYSRNGLPEFDWSVTLYRQRETNTWQLVEKPTGNKWLLFRATFPTHTRRHAQAAIHTQWTPSNPAKTGPKPVRFFGFRKINGHWRCVADSNDE